MKVIRTPGSGPGQRLVFDEAEFDAIALQALRDSQCLPSAPSPVRIDRFVEKHFGLTLGYEDLGPDVLGATAFAKTGKVTGMAVAPSLDQEESVHLFRSTTAHEAGHGLLHPILFMEDAGQSQFRIANADPKQRRILCRSSDIRPGQTKGYDGRWWEYQANRMIGALLLPLPLLRQAAEPFLTHTAVTGNPALAEERREFATRAIADTFHVSRMVASIRLSEVYPPSGGQAEF